MADFGTYLREQLARKQMSASELAQRAGIGRSTLYTYLSGRGSVPNEATLRSFAKALDVPLAELRRLVNLPSDATAKFELPAEAARLTPRQRKAVLAVVSAFLEQTPARGVQRPAR